MKKNLSTPLIYLVLLVVIIALVSGFDPRGNTAEEVSYNDFIQLVREEKVADVYKRQTPSGRKKPTGSNIPCNHFDWTPGDGSPGFF